MKYVALIYQGPNWVKGKTVQEQGPVIDAHLRSMRRCFAEKTLLLGGPFEVGGGIAVLDVPTVTAARDLMDADPAVRAGVLRYEMAALIPYFDAYEATRTDRDAAEPAAQ